MIHTDGKKHSKPLTINHYIPNCNNLKVTSNSTAISKERPRHNMNELKKDDLVPFSHKTTPPAIIANPQIINIDGYTKT
jgi:hypothetical protein